MDETAPEPAGTEAVQIVVAGAHLSGQPLNHELTDRGARLVASTTTAAAYRMFLLDVSPAKPGLVRVTYGGVPIEVEVWELGAAGFGGFVAGLAAPMAIARIELADGALVCGFSCEPVALEQAVDISGYGGWRAFRTAQTSGAVDWSGRARHREAKH